MCAYLCHVTHSGVEPSRENDRLRTRAKHVTSACLAIMASKSLGHTVGKLVRTRRLFSRVLDGRLEQVISYRSTTNIASALMNFVQFHLVRSTVGLGVDSALFSFVLLYF